jgi:hypothetical protein
MMSTQEQNIIDEIAQVFDLEREALAAYREQDPARYNALLLELHARTLDSRLHFGMEPRHQALSEFEVMMFKMVPRAVTVRNLYKVAFYEHPTYQRVYMAYTSTNNPAPAVSHYSDRFVFWRVEDELVVAAHFQFDNLNNEETYEWIFTAGERELTPEVLGAPVQVVRLLEPSTPASGIADHLLDK